MSRNAEKLQIEAPNLLSSKVVLYSADIGNLKQLPDADYIIHAAASTDEKSYLNQPELEKQNIHAATHNFCKLILNTAPGNNKILYISSGAVYGYQPVNLKYLTEDLDKYSIDCLPQGKQHYAYAKRSAEDKIRRLGSKKYNISIARCFAFIGPWLPREKHFAIGNFIQDGLLGGDITIKANYPVYRSYMHADDLVVWLMTICDNGSEECPIYNVGSDEEVSIIQAAEIVAKELNVKVNKNEEIKIDRIDRYIPSINKAKELLGLQISINLLDAIKRTIATIKND